MKENKSKFVILYHKTPTESVKMTRPASYRSCVRSVRSFERIGISPCEIVDARYKKTSKRKK